MDVTVDLPDDLVEKARAVAIARGITLDELVRTSLARAVGGALSADERTASALREMWATSSFRSDGTGYGSRDAIYEERLK